MKLAPLILASATAYETGSTAGNLLAAVGHRNVTRMEALIQNLAEESISEPAWKFDDDIKKALHAIRDMFVKSIQTALNDAHKHDQEDFNCFVEECFGKCNDEYRHTTGHCHHMEHKCHGLGDSHDKCRMTVYGSYKQMAQSCAALHCFEIPDPPCIPEDCLCPDLAHCHTATTQLVKVGSTLRAAPLVSSGGPTMGDIHTLPGSGTGAWAEATLSRYPGYDGDIEVTGYAGSPWGNGGEDGIIAITFHMEGVPQECAEGKFDESVPNACGIHIHEGKTCEDAGGHYWDRDSIEDDPWTRVRYQTWDSRGWEGTTGPQGGWTMAKVGAYPGADISGRAIVVHDHTGARVACGILPDGSKMRDLSTDPHLLLQTGAATPPAGASPALVQAYPLPDLPFLHTHCEARAGHCNGKFGSWLSSQIIRYQAAYEQWIKLYDQCKADYHAFLTVDMDCDKTQKEFEKCLCEKNSCEFTTCSINFEQCKEQCWGEYEIHVHEKECLEKDRKIDWSATKKIECYIDVLLHDYTKEELLTKCGKEDCVNVAREADYKHCATICPQVDHDGVWPNVECVDQSSGKIAIDNHPLRAMKDQYMLGDGHYKCDANGENVMTRHRGGVNRVGEMRCTEHLDIDYQIPEVGCCDPRSPPVCDEKFHWTWYMKFDDITRIGCINECCPEDSGKTCFPHVKIDTSYTGAVGSMEWIKVHEHSHAWAYNRCRCTECVEGYPAYPEPPAGRECGNGAHTISRNGAYQAHEIQLR